MLLMLEGRVTTGFGVARGDLARVAELICRRTGLPSLVPGTLNIRLGAPYRFEPDAEITEQEHGFERLKLKRCCVNGVRAVILRPETHESGNGHGDAYLVGRVAFRCCRVGVIRAAKRQLLLPPSAPPRPARRPAQEVRGLSCATRTGRSAPAGRAS